MTGWSVMLRGIRYRSGRSLVVLLLAAFVVIAVFVKTRAFVPTIIAFLLGAFLWFAVQNMEWLGERVQDEIQDEGRGRPAVERVL